MRLGAQFLLCFTLFSLHLTLPYIKTKGDFSPFVFTPSGHIFDETHFYSPGPHRFQRFALLSHDTDVFENRKSPGIYPQAPSIIIGGLAKLIGDFELTWILLHGLLPALLWLTATFAFGNSIWAWCLVLLGFGPRLALLMSPAAAFEPPDITRIPNPALSAIVLLWSMGLLVKCFKEGFPRFHTAALIVISGLLFEFYPFYAMVWFSTAFLLLGFLLLEKDYKTFRPLFVTTVLSLFLSAPTLWRVVLFQSQLKESIVLRQGFYSHEISFLGLILFAVSSIGSYLAVKNKNHLLGVSLAILGASGLCSNLQMITGVDIHYWLHYRMRLIQPILVVMCCAALVSKAMKVGPVLVSLLFLMTVYRQVNVSSALLSESNRAASQTEMLRWIRTNIAEPSVFSTTDLELIARLPAVSGHWSFVPSSYRTQSSDEEILKRHVLVSQLEGKTLDATLASIGAGPVDPRYAWTLPIYFFLRRPSVTPELQNEIRRLWREGTALGNRRLDYAIEHRSEKPDLDRNWVSVYENAEWRVLAPRKNSILSAN